ncbi:hypothetical protein ACTNDG_09040 [Clostridium sp. HCP1S3_B4]|nr:hypothetical protein [Clostridiales bacterium]MDY2728877.1 hypothetical protein [Clostridium sp.]
MSFTIFQCYIKVCRTINIRPSWKGLNNFKKYYDYELNNKIVGM